MILRALLIALVAVLALPAIASADVASVVQDCQDGTLNQRHSDADLQRAKTVVSTGDLAEYSNCGVLVAAALSRTGGEPSGGSRAGLDLGDPAAFTDENGLRRGADGVPVDADGRQVDPENFAPERKAEITRAREGEDIVPTAAGVRPGEPGTDLPAPLIALLAVCALAALAAGAAQLKRLGLLRRAA